MRNPSGPLGNRCGPKVGYGIIHLSNSVSYALTIHYENVVYDEQKVR
jgi:hypothetical protein